jgi:hypothetical protein
LQSVYTQPDTDARKLGMNYSPESTTLRSATGPHAASPHALETSARFFLENIPETC